MASSRPKGNVILVILLLLSCCVFGIAAEQPSAREQWLAAHQKPDAKRYFGDPINLSLKDADLAEVLRSFAEIGGFNLVLQPGIQGKVTVELRNVPWDQALEQILKINNLGMDISGSRARVGAGITRQGDLQALAPVTVRLELQHADPHLVSRVLSPAAELAPADRIQASVHGRILTLRASRPSLLQVSRFLTEIDTPTAVELLTGTDATGRERLYRELWSHIRQKLRTE